MKINSKGTRVKKGNKQFRALFNLQSSTGTDDKRVMKCFYITKHVTYYTV